MTAIRNVLIVGGGITGLTAAIALRRQGISVEVIELKHDPAAQTGIGLTLLGNALAALDSIGIAQQCVAAGMPADDMKLCKSDGSLLMTVPDPMLGGAHLPGHVSLSRKDLHRVLLDAARAAGAHVRLGTSFTQLDNHPDHVQVTFSDGSSGRYDLVVGADGVYSKTRKLLFPQHQLTPCHQAVWRAAVPRPTDVQTTLLHLQGPMGVVGICPITDSDAYLYIVEEASQHNLRYADDQLADVMRDKLKAYGGFVPSLANTLSDPQTISFRPLEWHLLPSPWYQDRIVIIGDAAHANPPVLAQGAAMGIEDAVVLSNELTTQNTVSAALKNFMTRRFARVATVVRNSVQLATWEVQHIPNVDVAGVMRDTNAVLAKPL